MYPGLYCKPLDDNSFRWGSKMCQPLGASDGQEFAFNAGSNQWVRSLGWEDSLREGNGNPFQYSSLENSMVRGAWWAIIHRVAKSWTKCML